MSWWAQAFDRGMSSDHLTARRFANSVVVEAAVDVVAARQEWTQPRCVGANARRRDADALCRQSHMKLQRVQLEATDRIDRRFAEHELL